MSQKEPERILRYEPRGYRGPEDQGAYDMRNQREGVVGSCTIGETEFTNENGALLIHLERYRVLFALNLIGLSHLNAGSVQPGCRVIVHSSATLPSPGMEMEDAYSDALSVEESMERARERKEAREKRREKIKKNKR